MEEGKPNPLVKILAIVLISFISVGVLTSICGVVAAKSEKRVFAILFGIFLTFVVLIYLVFGLALGSFSVISFNKMDDYCVNGDDVDQFKMMSKLYPIVTKTDTLFTDFVSETMCSDMCPCHMKYATTWTTSIGDEARLNEYNRTALQVNVGNYIPFVFNATDKDPHFDTFKDCFNARLNITKEGDAEFIKLT